MASIVSNLLFFRADEAEKLVKEAMRHRSPHRSGYDLNLTIHYMKEAIRLKPEREKYHNLLGWTYANLPYDAITYGVNVDFDLRDSARLAIAEFEKAIALTPNEPALHAALAVAYLDLGEKAKAKEAIKFLETRWSVRYRHLVEQLTRDLKEEMSPNPSPREAKRHLTQAITHRDMRRYREAEKEMLEVFKLAPNRAWLYNAICEVVDSRSLAERKKRLPSV